MDRNELTAAQRTVVDSDRRQVVFFGSRQIGKTTALTVDAIEEGMNGNRVAVTAPASRQAHNVIDRAREIVAENTRYAGRALDTNFGEITFIGGGRIEPCSTGHLVPKLADGPRGAPPKINDVDHVVIDDTDHIEPNVFDEIVDKADQVTVAGTPITDSPNIKPLVTKDTWFSVFERLPDTEFVESDNVDTIREIYTPTEENISVDGYFVSDPSNDADVVPAEE